MTTWYIGADVDCNTTVLAVRCNRRVVREYRVPTTIPALREALAKVPDPKQLTLEEGPLADWLYRNLVAHVDKLVVCDPRRNRLISDDGEKTNAVDARKLAELLDGGNLRAVYHGRTQRRVELKQWVSLYHDRVRDAVRQVNKLRGRCRLYGLRPVRGFLSNESAREAWLQGLEPAALAAQLRVLWLSYEAAREQVRLCRRELAHLSRGERIVGRWLAVPGVGLIRAMTFLAYLDTPWRFGSANKRWKYAGVGLERKTTGTDKQGHDKPGYLGVCLACNHPLKSALIGATITALNQGENKFSVIYARLLAKGVYAGNARRSAARKLLDTIVGMWKNDSDYESDLA